MVTCNECGCPFDDASPYCPECGNPNTQHSRLVNNTGITNCPNCGAPVTNNIACEYCESAYPRSTIGNGTTAIINNNVAQGNSGSGNAVGAGTAAFLGGLIGGILGD